MVLPLALSVANSFSILLFWNSKMSVRSNSILSSQSRSENVWPQTHMIHSPLRSPPPCDVHTV